MVIARQPVGRTAAWTSWKATTFAASWRFGLAMISLAMMSLALIDEADW